MNSFISKYNQTYIQNQNTQIKKSVFLLCFPNSIPEDIINIIYLYYLPYNPPFNYFRDPFFSFIEDNYDKWMKMWYEIVNETIIKQTK